MISFRKPCHMLFRKLIPPFTLTFVDGFIFSLKECAYLKYERILLYSNDRLVGF